ncbi:MAG: S-adenosylmethionine decarboxylase [Patescibacteria group bacterium]
MNKTRHWKNLAPKIVRQRVIIEGITKDLVMPDQIRKYLNALAKVTGMEITFPPMVYKAHELGYGGWVRWRTSGCVFYSYSMDSPLPTKNPFFTVDCYTCKPFDVKKAAEFTRTFFNAIELVWKEVGV